MGATLSIKRKQPAVALVLGGLFLVILLYNAPRYIFQYNSVATSPQYAATPTAVKTGKYLLVLALMLVYYLRARFGKRAPASVALLFLVAGILLLYNLLYLAFGQTLSFDELEYLFFFFVLSPLLFVRQDTPLKFIHERMESTIGTTFWYMVLANAIVLGNYLLTGRLPALAYGGLTNRYGTFWDDPNAAGFLFAVFCVWFLWRQKYWLCLLALLNVLLAQSLTAFGVLVAGLIFIYLHRFVNYLAWLVVLLAVTALLVSLNLEAVIFLYEMKKGSIMAHLNFYFPASDLLPFSHPVLFHETWYYSFLWNYFPFSALVLAIIFFFFLKLLLAKQKDFTSLFLFSFFTGSLLLPYLYSFPLNVIFFIMLFLYLKGFRYHA